MDALRKRADAIRRQIEAATFKMRLSELQAELEKITAEIAEPDFWNDATAAATISKKQAELQGRIGPWVAVKAEIDEAVELLALDDSELEADIAKQLDAAEQFFGGLKKELRYNGPFDARDAILSIYAGAGGTDAQDWAAMLLRMYVRWAEAHQYKLSTVLESAGEEAGIKTVTVEISGPMAYGKLKGEHGVHRLVRLSPFNADNLRQTSFAKVEVLPKIDKPDEVSLDAADLKIDVYRAGGHGGQSVNTTDSAVRVTHLPTGLTVAIQNERSQLQNKETALTIIRSKLAQLQLEQHAERISELKGPNEQASWGNQIRSYVLHPYKMVKDLRSNEETSDADGVLDGGIDPFLDSFDPTTV